MGSTGIPACGVTAVICSAPGIVAWDGIDHAAKQKPRWRRGFERGRQGCEVRFSASCEQLQPGRPTRFRAIRVYPAQER
jgi:hypothetical protein